jgi:glycerol-3-phosphate cytidylyltransferase-like family protein
MAMVMMMMGVMSLYTACKGPPVMNDEERLAAVEGCRFVNEVVEGVPYIMQEDYLMMIIEKYKIDFVVHGDDPCIVNGKVRLRELTLWMEKPCERKDDESSGAWSLSDSEPRLRGLTRREAGVSFLYDLVPIRVCSPFSPLFWGLSFCSFFVLTRDWVWGGGAGCVRAAEADGQVQDHPAHGGRVHHRHR